MPSVDIGCGVSKVSKYFIGINDIRLPGVDYVLNAENLEYINDCSENIVYSKRCLQHVVNDLQALKEMNRILTVDGLVILEVAGGYKVFFAKLLNYLKIKTYRYKFFRQYSRNELEKKIKVAGLRVVTYAKVPTRFGSNHLFILAKGDS